MTPRFAIFVSVYALALTGCDEPAAPKTEVPARPAVAAAPAKADTAEQLQKLQGKLPRMDPEKAKFIAVPSTPPDEKPEPKAADKAPVKVEKPEKVEEVKKAAPAK